MSESPVRPAAHDFGIVAEHSDCFEFQIDGTAGENCRLVAFVQTERGPRRTELVEAAGATWRKINTRVVRELAQDMGETEMVGKKAPGLKTGINRLSPLVGRELALLLWALQEEGAADQIEAILHGWRELAREERWWLYAKAAAHGQQTGSGWRRGSRRPPVPRWRSAGHRRVRRPTPPAAASARVSAPASPAGR